MDEKSLTGYELSKDFFNFMYENPNIANPTSTALYFFIIEHSNRMGWKQVFRLPTSMAMDAIGIKNYKTYIKALNILIDTGFIRMVEKSKNQYSANIIALVKNTKALTKALTKASTKHMAKQVQSTVSIDKLLNLLNSKPIFITSLNNTKRNKFYFLCIHSSNKAPKYKQNAIPNIISNNIKSWKLSSIINNLKIKDYTNQNTELQENISTLNECIKFKEAELKEFKELNIKQSLEEKNILENKISILENDLQDALNKKELFKSRNKEINFQLQNFKYKVLDLEKKLMDSQFNLAVEKREKNPLLR